MRRARLPDRFHHIPGCDSVRHHDGEVALHGRIARKLLEPDHARALGGESVEVELRRVKPDVRAVLFRNIRMDLAEIADHFAVHGDVRTSSRMQERERGAAVLGSRVERLKERVDDAFQSEIVCAAAIHADDEFFSLFGEFRERQGLGMIGLCDLEKSRALVEVRRVVGEHFKHAVREHRAHDAERLSERIDQLHPPSQSAVRGDAQLVRKRGRSEGIGDALIESEGGELLLCAVAESDVRGHSALRQPGMREQRGLDVGVAVHSDELLRKVVDAVDVRARVRDVRDKLPALLFVHGDTEAGEDGDKLLFGHFAAEDALDLLHREGDVSDLFVVDLDIYDALADDAAARLIDEGERAFETVLLRCEIYAFLKARGAVRTQVEGAGSPSHAVARELGGLEYDGGSVRLYAAVLPSHDAGDRDGLFRVADGEH